MTGLFPPQRQVLYPDQAAALEELRKRLRAGKRRPLLVAPTGAGKTTIAAEMIHGAVQRDGDVLFLAHRKELIEQASARLDGVGVDHGILMAQHPRHQPWARVQVASVATLARRLDDLPRATLILVDEAHHARAASYSHILDRYPGVAGVGLTATPWRLDGRGLGELFDDIVVASTPAELIRSGRLVPYTGFAYDTPDLSRVHKSGADYKADELAAAMGKGTLAGNIVEQWLKHARGLRTVLFAVNIAHSLDLVARFKAQGVRAEHVDGTMSPAEREGVLARFARGETTVVCNVAILGEGYDLPAIECVVLARPTLSQVIYLQQVGRGLRKSPGKTVCRLHDHAGCILRHGLPDAARDYSLTTGKTKGPAQDPAQSLRRCLSCFALYDAATAACPQCGAVHTPKPRKIHEDQNAEAIPIEQLRLQQDARKVYLDALLAEAERRGKKRGWAAYKYKLRFGHWPPQHFWAGGMKQLDAGKLQRLSERLRAHLGGGK